jgi:hypothetical protein
MRRLHKLRRLHRLAIGVAMTMGSTAMAAELGQQYDSYRDMHERTSYGGLFFNEGAIRVEQSRSLKRFKAITGSGTLNLPPQNGYCFVFNHYNPDGNSKSHTYKWKITKWRGSEPDKPEEDDRPYTPAADVWAAKLPDLCVDGIQGVTKVAIELTSDDGKYFDWNISFDIK